MVDIDLKQARELLNLSQIELDRRAGVPEGTTHDLEKGRNKRPAHETVTKIIRALHRAGLTGVSAVQLFPVGDDEAIAS